MGRSQEGVSGYLYLIVEGQCFEQPLSVLELGIPKLLTSAFGNSNVDNLENKIWPKNKTNFVRNCPYFLKETPFCTSSYSVDNVLHAISLNLRQFLNQSMEDTYGHNAMVIVKSWS